MSTNKTKRQISLKPGQAIMDVYKDYSSTYWFITDKFLTHDTHVEGKIYKDDQLLFGYIWFSARHELFEFGFISQIDL